MKKFNIFWHDKGVAMIEFALLAPLMLLLTLGLYEISNYVYVYTKMSRISETIGNIVTRNNITSTQLATYLKSADKMAKPFNFSACGRVIVTQITKTSSNPNNFSQLKQEYGGGAGVSKVNLNSLPGNLTLSLNETIIITEVFYNYTPSYMASFFSPQSLLIYMRSLGKPRQNPITTSSLHFFKDYNYVSFI